MIGAAFVFSLFCGVTGWVVAPRFGRGRWGWAFLSLAFGPLGLLLLFLLPKNDLRAEAHALSIGRLKKCPYCAELIKREATICRYCGKQQDEAGHEASYGPARPSIAPPTRLLFSRLPFLPMILGCIYVAIGYATHYLIVTKFISPWLFDHYDQYDYGDTLRNISVARSAVLSIVMVAILVLFGKRKSLSDVVGFVVTVIGLNVLVSVMAIAWRQIREPLPSFSYAEYLKASLLSPSVAVVLVASALSYGICRMASASTRASPA